MDQLIERLNALGEDIELRFDYINSGGCCVFAAAVATELERHGIKVGGVVLSEDEPPPISIGMARRHTKRHGTTMKAFNDREVWFSHVGIEFVYRRRTYVYDSSGVKKKGEPIDRLYKYPYKGLLTVKELNTLADTNNRGDGTSAWSSMFNRMDIPKVKKMVLKHLS